MTRWDVLGLGENSIDEVYRLPSLPARNGKLPISEHRTRAGGQVATTMCTCAAFGLRAAYLGAIGTDANGARIRAELTQRGVDLTPSLAREAGNRYAVVLVDERTGERVVLWQRPGALAIAADDLDAGTIAAARLLHVDAVDEDAAIAAARIATAAGRPVTTDIDRVTPRTRELVDAASVPILAEQVPAALTGEPDVERALRRLRRDGQMVCVTLGAHGALLFDGAAVHYDPGFAVDVVDTTGAGDVFRGAFIHALLRGDDPPAILRFANAAAALSCTREGAIDGVPSLGEVEHLARTKGTKDTKKAKGRTG